MVVKDTTLPAFIVVSAGDIAERAYKIYVDRGRADGFDSEDWLRAERELKAGRSGAPGKGSTKSRNTVKQRQL